MKQLSALFLLLVILTGCQRIADYNYHFHEGQPYSEKRLAQVKVGQTQQTVLKLLGSPLYRNVLDKRRWYYLSHIKRRHFDGTQRFIVEFNASGRVAKIERS